MPRYEHCPPVARQLNILLFGDLLYLYTACLTYEVFNNKSCDVVCNLFCSVCNVYSTNTRASILNLFVPSCCLILKYNVISFYGTVMELIN